MRLIPLLVVLAGCLPQTSGAPVSSGASRSRPPNTPTYAANVVAWLARSETGTDCPMSIVETRQTRWATTKGRGDAEYWLNRVACLCDVVDRGSGFEYDGACGDQPTPSVAKDGVSQEALRMLSWENRLVGRIRDGVPPDKLVRSTPLAAQLKEVRKALAATGAQDSEHWNELQKAVERVRSDVAGDVACLLEEDLLAVKTHLKNHEKLDLGGLKSKPGRELLAEAELLVKPLRARMRGCKMIDKAP